MEHERWEKDQNPYLIVTCSKCKQYMYVKTTQKTKKCLRCGRQHKVSAIISSGEIVKGMTKAVEIVKTRQNELAIKEIGNPPEFRATDDFIVRSRKNSSSEEFTPCDDSDLESKFKEMIREISISFGEFPYYILEIMAENYTIPLSELRILVKNSQKEGFLIRLKDNLYRIKP